MKIIGHKTKKSAKRGRPSTGKAATNADRQQKHVAAHSVVEWRDLTPEQAKLRKKLEADPEKWLRYFLAEAYFRPFGKLHQELIANAVTASRTGGRICIAGERGVGKSSIMWGVVLMLKLSGEQEFPVCIPWDAGALKRALKFWRNALCFNQKLLELYPEYCAPFAHAKGVSQRLQATTWDGGPRSGEATGCQIALTDGLIVMPDSRGCIGGATVNGNPRGLNHSMPDGRILRPTLILLDDVQDRQVAKSERLVQQTVDVIDGDVGGMGDSAKVAPMVMCGNCIETDDVMAHYLQAENWVSMKIPCIASFPTDWKDGDGPAADLWKEWYSRHVNNDGAVAYFKANKAAMFDGFELNSPKSYAVTKKLPDPRCSVMEQYFKMGHRAFMAEKQQEPIKQTLTLYDLNNTIITAKTNKELDPQTIPDWCSTVIAATDVNPSYALSTVIAGFGTDQRAAVAWYGKHKLAADRKRMTDSELKAYVMGELQTHGNQLLTMPCKPSIWIIDGGGTPVDTVKMFASQFQQRHGIRVITCFGRSSTQYTPRAGGGGTRRLIPYEQCHIVFENRTSQWLLANADYWREQAQRGWMGADGAPGSIELCRGNHREFADQICREKLETKADGGTRMLWVWRTLPGEHDFGDCMMMLFVGAAVSGIGTGGQVVMIKKQKQKQRGVRHVKV